MTNRGKYGLGIKMSLSDWASFFGILSSLKNLMSIDQWMLAIISGSLGTVAGVLLGAVLTYLVEKKTQNRAWEREHTADIAKSLYIPLYPKIGEIMSNLEKPDFSEISFDEWGQIQKSGVSLTIEEKFREEMNRFYERLQKYNETLKQVRKEILPRIIREETERIFETSAPFSLAVIYKFPDDSGDYEYIDDVENPELIDCLIAQKPPMEYVYDNILKRAPHIYDLDFAAILGRDGLDEEGYKKFDEFWESCLKRAKENRMYNYLTKENKALLKKVREIKDELNRLIQEPWRT